MNGTHGLEPAQRPSRRWWRLGGVVFSIVFLLAALGQAVSLIGTSSETVRPTFDTAAIEHLDLSTHSGDISLVSTDGDELRVVARVHHGLWRTELTSSEVDGVLRLRDRCPLLSMNCSVDYAIEVPRGVRVTAHSGNGDVDARDLDGGSELSSDNGDVLALDLRGTTHLSSANGEVRAEGMQSERVRARSDNGDVMLRLALAPSALAARSGNGDVTVELPDGDEFFALDLSSGNGERVGDIRTDPDSDRRMVVRSDNGDVTVRYRTG